MREDIRKYLSEIGSRGGRKSRRVLEPTVARKMVRTREAKRAYAKFHALCFWSFDPNLSISASDIPWLVGQLRKNGNREAWNVADRLCP